MTQQKKPLSIMDSSQSAVLQNGKPNWPFLHKSLASRLPKERESAMHGVGTMTITDDEKDDTLVRTLHSVETELTQRRFNLQRYEAMMESGDELSEDYTNALVGNLLGELDGIAMNSSTIRHLVPQLPSRDRVDAALERIRAQIAEQ